MAREYTIPVTTRFISSYKVSAEHDDPGRASGGVSNNHKGTQKRAVADMEF